MTLLLQKAFERAVALPQEEQDRIARFLLSELESEERWAELFSRPESEKLLEKMANVNRSCQTESSPAGRTLPPPPARATSLPPNRARNLEPALAAHPRRRKCSGR